jgi:hypothetical protein
MVTRMILSSVLTIMTSVLNAGISFSSIRFIFLSKQLDTSNIRFIYFVINNKVCMYLIKAIIVHILWSQYIYVKGALSAKIVNLCYP